MIGDSAREKTLILRTAEKVPVARLIIDLHGRNLAEGLIFADRDEGIVSTNGNYGLAWKPSVKLKGKLTGDYIIYSDLYEKRSMRFDSYEGFVNSSAAKLVNNFMLQWSSISDKLFLVAKNNPGVTIPFTLDIPKYDEYLRKQFSDLGIDTTGCALLSSGILDEIAIEARQRKAEIIRETSELDRARRDAAAREEHR